MLHQAWRGGSRMEDGNRRYEIRSYQDVLDWKVTNADRLHSASEDEIRQGLTTDVYFVKTYEILKELGLLQKKVTAEIFASRAGVAAGIEECINLLKGRELQIWGIPEGEAFSAKEVVMRIEGQYADFGLYETALLGMLASASGWATAAREIKMVAGNRPVICFGSRHVHPAVAPVMERAAMVAGVDGASCILGAKLLGVNPRGTIPHAAMLLAGDTLEVALTFDRIMPADETRIVLVDTFKDEAEEALRVAGEMKERLHSIRLDTPSERGGVTPALVREVRARLDLAGFSHVGIFVTGGLTPDRIPSLIEAGATGFGVGSYISGAPPIDMTMDIKEIEGQPVAKRGRIPGLTPSDRLVRLQ